MVPLPANPYDPRQVVNYLGGYPPPGSGCPAWRLSNDRWVSRLQSGHSHAHSGATSRVPTGARIESARRDRPDLDVEHRTHAHLCDSSVRQFFDGGLPATRRVPCRTNSQSAEGSALRRASQRGGRPGLRIPSLDSRRAHGRDRPTVFGTSGAGCDSELRTMYAWNENLLIDAVMSQVRETAACSNWTRTN